MVVVVVVVVVHTPLLMLSKQLPRPPIPMLHCMPVCRAEDLPGLDIPRHTQDIQHAPRVPLDIQARADFSELGCLVVDAHGGEWEGLQCDCGAESCWAGADYGDAEGLRIWHCFGWFFSIFLDVFGLGLGFKGRIVVSL